jgi:site-specific DNA-cytosine methylase
MINGQEQREISQQEQIELGGGSSGTLWPSNWEFEPNVGRVANGVPGRVHRLKGLGNSIVPKIAEEIGKAIIGVYNGSR